MDLRTNTIAGWVLAACGAALAFSVVGKMAVTSEKPEKPGYPLEGAAPAGDAAAAGPVVPLPTLLASADPAKGEAVFKQCASCHTIAQGGANGIGPNLWGTLGEPIGQGKGGYAFSDALKGVGGNWDFEKMNAWLTNPRKFASGTKMTFAGLSKPEDRANVIVYLNSQGSNLPLPKAAEVPADAAGSGPAAGEAKPGDKATPSADNLGDKGQIAPGAPSVDPAAKK